MRIQKFEDGYVLNADSTCIETKEKVKELVGDVHLIVTDPPYGNIVKDKWDQTNETDDKFADWMCDWTKMWTNVLVDSAAFYVWGGVGKIGFRPFLKYLTRIESPGKFELANLITWKKKNGPTDFRTTIFLSVKNALIS